MRERNKGGQKETREDCLEKGTRELKRKHRRV
jgi:hypothetical protein